MPIRFWTNKETKILIKQKAVGLSFADIGKLVDRTTSSVKERWYWINRTEADKEERRLRMAQARIRAPRNDQPQAMRSNRLIPADVLEDRKRRLDAPRSLSAVLLGDPPFPARLQNEGSRVMDWPAREAQLKRARPTLAKVEL